MSIVWNKQDKTITLYTNNSSYQMKVDKHNVLLHTYYGKKIENMDMSYRIVYRDRGFSGNPFELNKDRTYSLDNLPQEYSTFGGGDYRQPGVSIRQGNGSYGLELRYVAHEITSGKYGIPGLPALYDNNASLYDEKMDEGYGQWNTLTVTLKDIEKEIYVYLNYGVYEENDCITRSIIIENKEWENIYVDRAMSMSLDILSGTYDLIHFPGRYAMERIFKRERLESGIKNITSLRGASGHQENPFAIVAHKDTTEIYGEAIGIGLIYSGSFRISCEVDHINQLRVLAGIEPDMFGKTLKQGERFYTPEVMLVYSHDGFEKLSNQVHEIVNNNLIRNKIAYKYKPVLVNSWESVYFTYNIDKLKTIARESGKLGIDLFVLDDGWFGKRENDLSGLGDWYENQDKLGGSLRGFSDYIHGLGMKFGLWFEPECVSEDSNLYREHPEWAITIEGRKPQRSRYQLVLNMANKDVQEYLYERLSTSIREFKLDYIKWDFNRSLSDWFDNTNGITNTMELPHEYILGLYALLERLTMEFPEVLWEGCSGGGGRFDYGMLYYMPQIWCSDNTDAINRLHIQYGTSFGYPVAVIGSHISAIPNHQNGRITPFKTRAAVAYHGSFGYELNIELLDDFEKNQIREQIKFYKDNFELIHRGSYYRLTGIYDTDVVAWQIVSGDKKRALITVVYKTLEANRPVQYIKCRGLNQDKNYRITSVSMLDVNEEETLIVKGDALMEGGLSLPIPKTEYESFIYMLDEII